MSLNYRLWAANTKPPVYKVGDEVCYWNASAFNEANTIIKVRMTTSFDGDETFQEIMVAHTTYWLPASEFAPVRRLN